MKDLYKVSSKQNERRVTQAQPTEPLVYNPQKKERKYVWYFISPLPAKAEEDYNFSFRLSVTLKF